MVGPENHLSPARSDKPVLAPSLAADAVADKEQTVGIVSLLDGEQPGIVRTPIGPLPVSLKVTALRDVSAAVWRRLPQFRYSLFDPSGIAARCGEVRFVPGKTRKRRRALAGDDRQHERAAYAGAHRRIPGSGDDLRRSSREPLLEMQLDRPMPARRHQRVNQRLPLRRLEQPCRHPERFEAMNEMPRLGKISRPEE